MNPSRQLVRVLCLWMMLLAALTACRADAQREPPPATPATDASSSDAPTPGATPTPAATATPAATPTPEPTPTREATATPEPTIVPPADAERVYRQVVSDAKAAIDGASGEIGALIERAGFVEPGEQDAWVADHLAQATIIETHVQAIIDYPAASLPPAYTGSHADIVAAARTIREGMQVFRKGLEAMDGAQLARSGDIVSEARRAMADAIAALPSTTVAAAPEEIPEGMSRRETELFSLFLPNEWAFIDPTTETWLETFRQINAVNPLFGDTLTEEEAAEFDLFAIEVMPADPAVGSAGLGVLHFAREGVDADALRVRLAEVLLEQFDQEGVTVLESDAEFEVAGQPATYFAVEIPVNVPSGGSIAGTIQQYNIIGTENVWSVTYSYPSARAEELRPVIEQSVHSFRPKVEAWDSN